MKEDKVLTDIDNYSYKQQILDIINTLSLSNETEKIY